MVNNMFNSDLKVKFGMCHKKTQCNGNLEARKLVSDAVSSMFLANMYLLVQKPPVLSVYVQIINQEYIAQTGHKLKAVVRYLKSSVINVTSGEVFLNCVRHDMHIVYANFSLRCTFHKLCPKLLLDPLSRVYCKTD